MTEDEKLLIDLCIKGERKAQQMLYDKYARKMMALCFRYVKNKEDASDLLQEGFIKVFTNLKRFSGEGSFDGWVRKIFVNSALEFLRHKDIMREAYSINDIELETIEEPVDYNEQTLTQEQLMQYVMRLPVGFRTVFNMFAIEGYSHSEIAEALKIAESTSRSQYLRARKQLREMILGDDK